MRVSSLTGNDQETAKEFSEYLLKVGEDREKKYTNANGNIYFHKLFNLFKY